MFGIAQTMVMPPAKAAAVPDEKSSLWVWPVISQGLWVYAWLEDSTVLAVQGPITGTREQGIQRLAHNESEQITLMDQKDKITNPCLLNDYHL